MSTYLGAKKNGVRRDGSIFVKLRNSFEDLNLGEWLHPITTIWMQLVPNIMRNCEMNQKNQYHCNFQEEAHTVQIGNSAFNCRPYV